jgi:hypothetical protein
MINKKILKNIFFLKKKKVVKPSRSIQFLQTQNELNLPKVHDSLGEDSSLSLSTQKENGKYSSSK